MTALPSVPAMHRIALALICLLAVAACGTPGINPASVLRPDAGRSGAIDPGPRALQLARELPDSQLRRALENCADGPFQRTRFAIAHRGAPLGYPEHTREGYTAAARMGAGIIECDVTFTRDLQLVCRHSQCDLHRTTDILQTPLARHCSTPFTPARGDEPASARCCTSDITLAQFRTLCGRRDIVDPAATEIDDYLAEPPSPVVAQPLTCGTLITHAQSIELIDRLGADFTPELKAPEVGMPFQGNYTQQMYADQMINEYKAAGIPPQRVSAQSFNLDDIRYWIGQHPETAATAVWLDSRGRQADFVATRDNMQALYDQGVRTIAPPIPMLIELSPTGELQPSAYARLAREAGLDIITWTFESGDAGDPDNWLYRHLGGYVDTPGRMLEVLHVLHDQVQVKGVFSDWPGTVSYYASCMQNQ